jgi:hypothetical protein
VNAAIANRAGELLRCRAGFLMDEAACLAWIGIGRATLERIGSGEVEAEPDVLQRIDRFLGLVAAGVGNLHYLSDGGHLLSPSAPGLSLAHDDGPLAGGGRNVPAGLFEGQQ